MFRISVYGVDAVGDFAWEPMLRGVGLFRRAGDPSRFSGVGTSPREEFAFHTRRLVQLLSTVSLPRIDGGYARFYRSCATLEDIDENANDDDDVVDAMLAVAEALRPFNLGATLMGSRNPRPILVVPLSEGRTEMSVEGHIWSKRPFAVSAGRWILQTHDVVDALENALRGCAQVEGPPVVRFPDDEA